LGEDLLAIWINFDGAHTLVSKEEVGKYPSSRPSEEMKRSKVSCVQLIGSPFSPFRPSFPGSFCLFDRISNGMNDTSS